MSSNSEFKDCDACGKTFGRRLANGKLIVSCRWPARRFCSLACARLPKTGPLAGEDVLSRIMSETAMLSESECWIFGGFLTDDGYARVSMGGLHYRGHRLVFELTRGPIPAGVFIDHICRNRPCLNPAHLRLATNAENGQNRVAQANSKSGLRNVFLGRRGRWHVQLRRDGRSVYQASFVTLEEATEAAEMARRRFHPHYMPNTANLRRAS